MKKFEQLSHTADIKIRVYGKTLSELFAHACIGMFTIIEPHVRESASVEQEWREVSLSAPDKEILLVDFLSEALYLSDVHNEAYLKVVVHECSDTVVHATLFGSPVLRFELEVKAVTYHDLCFKKTPDGLSVDIVFDI